MSDEQERSSIEDLTNDEILDSLERPREFFGTLTRNVADQVKGQVFEELRRQETDAALAKTFEAFGDDHPGFKEMVESGELQKFIDERPGNNLFSAFHCLQEEKVRVEKERARGGGPKARDPRLADPRAHGGTTAVLAARAEERRAVRGHDSFDFGTVETVK
jgi:hypothetical protein